MKLETLKISKIINGGYGLTHLPNGQVILVRHVLPDETVTVTTEKTKKNFIFGEAKQIISCSPERRPPPCRYYGQCGGCNMQHCNYSSQLAIKKHIIEDLLIRSSNETLRDVVELLADPIPAPEEFHYRQRIRLQINERGVPGFHQFQSHTVVPVETCLLAREEENSALSALKAHPDGRKLTENSLEVELQENPATGKTVVICKLSRKPRAADILSAQRFCRETAGVERVFLTGDTFSLMGPYGLEQGEADISLRVEYPKRTILNQDVNLSWEAGGFCQVNLQQNINLIATVLSLSEVKPTDRVLDLYCGMGNFAIPLAMLAKEVIGIEGQGSAIRSAAQNAASAGLENTFFRKSPIHDACSSLTANDEQFNCVVIDPPRQGAPGLASSLAALTCDRLVYISCDPATLCRDLADLCGLGFSIKKIQPIDMFPQTHHIETVVLLHRN